MRFSGIEYSRAVGEKIQSKHGVSPSELDEVLGNAAEVRRAARGLYSVSGRTDAGRYIVMLLRDLGGGFGRLVTAREMSPSERRAQRRRR